MSTKSAIMLSKQYDICIQPKFLIYVSINKQSLFFTVYGVSDRASADIKYAQFLMCIKVHLLNIILANILTISEKYELSKRSDIFSLCCDCKLQLPGCVSCILCFGTDYVIPDQTTHLRCLIRVYTACHFPFMEIG